MGDGLFMEMLSGRAPALLSALKSLPTYDEDTTGNAALSVREQELALTRDLRARLQSMASEFTTTLGDDEALLLVLEGGTRDAGGFESVALRYRIGRKRIAAAMDTILRVYERVVVDMLP